MQSNLFLNAFMTLFGLLSQKSGVLKSSKVLEKSSIKNLNYRVWNSEKFEEKCFRRTVSRF